ncbi:MAG: hypothetical protein AB7Q17_08750 [Phycisphaerae bacterium]
MPATLRAQSASGGTVPELRRLIDDIATGDEVESNDAAERLVARIVNPLADALGNLESRPAAEQVRLRKVLGRLTAALRAKVFRASLTESDSKLLDALIRQDAELVEQCFHEDARTRLSALRRIPHEPDSGAGLLVAALVNDADADVASAALEAAAALKGPVLARALTRYVADASQALKSGHYGPNEQEVAYVVAMFVARSIEILGESRARESVPAIVASLEALGRSAYAGPEFYDISRVARALGRIGDERAVPALLALLNDNRTQTRLALGAGKLGEQTVGDVALLGVLEIYGLDPRRVGFYIADRQPQPFVCFLDHESRLAAYRTFMEWHKQNADRPVAERKPLTTRPAQRGGATTQPAESTP